MAKKSIRFYNDYKVRAVWDDDHSKWWFRNTYLLKQNLDNYLQQ